MEDGKYGPRLEGCVRTFQDLRKITSDGICGPQTQQHLAQRLILSANDGLPGGLLLSISEGESGNLIAAVNWGVSGGVDCGYVQRRVLGPPFDDGSVRRAFDSLYQFQLVRAQLLERFGLYKTRPAVHSIERAWRLAVYHHNHPAGADRFSRTEYKNLSSYWKSPQPWVVAIGAKFPDGVAINTPWQWAQHYSLGSTEHNDPGRMVRYVSEWT